MRSATGSQSSMDAPAAPALGQEVDGLGHAVGPVGEAPLGVDAEREVGGRRQVGHVGHEEVAVDGHVATAPGGGQAGAGGGQGLEAEGGQQAGRAAVEGVGHHEGALGVERAEAVTAGGGVDVHGIRSLTEPATDRAPPGARLVSGSAGRGHGAAHETGWGGGGGAGTVARCAAPG